MSFPLANLRAFEAAARLLSFTLAAVEMNLTQSAVSQQIKVLEDRLGFPVFRRLTRRLELTDQGLVLYETVRRALLDLDLAVETLRDETMHGTVVLSVGSSFAANWLIPRLGRFSDTYPDIELSIQPTDHVIDLVAEPSVDVSVRFAQRPAGDVVVEPLGVEQVFVAASPDLMRETGPPDDIRDLGQFTLLHSEPSEREEGAAGDWRNWLAALGHDGAIDAGPGPRFARGDLVVNAAVHGQGVALVWDTMVARECAEGRLVKVFGGRYETTNSYIASCARRTYRKPKVRAVMDWLTREAGL